MKEMVIDSSVVIKWFVVEPYSTEAQRILKQYQKGSISLLAPDFINAEVGNIVWKKHRIQNLKAEDAQQIIDTFRTLDFTLTSTADLLDHAYRLAVVHQRTVYDMLYVALSVREQCPFVTADEKLVNAIGRKFTNMVWIAEWK
ncbi:MAG: type II toxin-antitoxin system VapC family toxin [Thiomargarita sp.]|nr:type II toxin-antitoxin system VapC family toxin [Thiomargarita sp.]